MTVQIVVLNDGETWSTISGCSVCSITEEDYQALQNGDIGAAQLEPISEIALNDCTQQKGD